MKHLEQPSEESIESYSDDRELSPDASIYQALEETKERVSEGKPYLTKKDEELILQKKKEITDELNAPKPVIKTFDMDEALKGRPTGEESLDHYEKDSKKSWLKRTFLALGFGTASLFGAHKEAKSTETEPKRITSERPIARDSLDQKKNVIPYTQSKTEKGSITPTGLNNSFFENKFNITSEDIETIAKKHGFRTDNTLHFQTDLIDYIQQHHPEIIAKTFETFGSTAKGDGVEGLKDGLLGARTAFILSELNKEIPNIPSEEIKTPSQEFSQPTGGFVINVRGDEHGNAGVYYFLNSKKDFDELTKRIPKFSAKEFSDSDTKGQATYNMNQNVFLEEYVTEEEQSLLGTEWIRDPRDPKKFIPKKSTTY